MTEGNGLSRRSFLSRAAGLAVAPTLLPALAAAARHSKPLQGLPSTRAVWEWHERIADGGPRLTGNRAHRRFIEFAAEELERLGYTVHRDHHRFTRWAPRQRALRIGDTDVPTSFYFPYSGVTPTEGVTAPLAYCGPTPGAFSGARGKIAFVDCPLPALPPSVLFRDRGRYPADSPGPPLLASEIVVNEVSAPALSAAKSAGALGVVCAWQGISDALAADQYSPFTTPYFDCPAVWLDPTHGDEVRSAALAGASATLVMDAALIPKAPTETIYVVLPGSERGESIIVNTHTDGPNVPEENGGLALLALARYFKGLPRSRRRRTLVFAFVTGHFQLPQFEAPGGSMATSLWMADHPELLDGASGHLKAVAGLTVEHMGCREWLDNAAHTEYAPTGLNDVGFTYTTTDAMVDIWLSSAAGTANERTQASEPVGIYFGEGAPLRDAGLPTISMITAPSYLLAAPKDGAISKLDRRLVMGQIQTFAKAIRAIDAMPAEALGVPG